MTDLQRRLADVRASLPESVQLVAVSKFHPAELIREANVPNCLLTSNGISSGICKRTR